MNEFEEMAMNALKERDMAVRAIAAAPDWKQGYEKVKNGKTTT
jgi:hypothetical protein